MSNWICETSQDRWFKVQSTISMVNVSVTYPAQLTISLVYFMYLTWMRPEDVVMMTSQTHHLKYSALAAAATTQWVTFEFGAITFFDLTTIDSHLNRDQI